MGLETAASEAAGDQRGELGWPGPGLIYFSINKRCNCWGVAWERATDARSLYSAAICPLARRGGFFFTAAVMQQDCLACLHGCSLLTDSPSFWYRTPRTHMELLKRRHLLCFSLSGECVRVCYSNTCWVCSSKGAAALNSGERSFTRRLQMWDEEGV